MYFEEIELGSVIELDSAVVEKDKMIDFALLYDNVPLHTDEDYASTTPFGQLIAPGVMSFLVVWAKYLEKDIFGEQLLAGKSTKIEWLKPVFANDILKGKTTVTNLIERNEKNGIVELTTDVFNQNNQLVLINVTQAIVKRKQKV